MNGEISNVALTSLDNGTASFTATAFDSAIPTPNETVSNQVDVTVAIPGYTLNLTVSIDRPALSEGRCSCAAASAGSAAASAIAASAIAASTLVASVIAASAEGYSFPTNLDSDPPLGGMAPKTQAQLLQDALDADWAPEALAAALDAQYLRKQP